MTAIIDRGRSAADRAEPLAAQWLALLEGAFILCRAARSTGSAGGRAGRAAAALVTAALQ